MRVQRNKISAKINRKEHQMCSHQTTTISLLLEEELQVLSSPPGKLIVQSYLSTRTNQAYCLCRLSENPDWTVLLIESGRNTLGKEDAMQKHKDVVNQ